jgi:hypothetical protein
LRAESNFLPALREAGTTDAGLDTRDLLTKPSFGERGIIQTMRHPNGECASAGDIATLRDEGLV